MFVNGSIRFKTTEVHQLEEQGHHVRDIGQLYC